MITSVIYPNALLANLDGDPARAARLMGAAMRLIEDFDLHFPDFGMTPFGDPRTDALAALGEEEFERASREGHEMDLDEAVSLIPERETDPP
jgi:hypothetical protein